MELTKEAINNRFVESLTEMLKNRQGLSKKKIAASLNMKPAKLSEILGGRMSVSLEDLAKYSVLYNVDVNWLMTGRQNVLEYGNMRNSENQNYVSDSFHDYQNLVIVNLENQNNLLRGQLDILNGLVVSQQDTIEAFKRGDIVVAKLS